MQWMIGIDWGTSSLRAMLYDGEGHVHEYRKRPWGVRSLPGGSFEAAFTDIFRDWPECPTWACGMLGSRKGWHEAGYVDTPADLAALTRHATRAFTAAGRTVNIVPGVRDPSSPDVMRGEETQVFGALEAQPRLTRRARIVLPGTHSKWVDVDDGRIVRSRTMMTGEIHALLVQHSILGESVPAAVETGSHPRVFDEGVRTARDSGNAGMLSRLFRTRVLALESQLSAPAVPDYLSGLLIGEEWRAMCASGWLAEGEVPVLVGENRLAGFYQRAARLFDLPEPELVTDASARGLWRIAQAAQASSGFLRPTLAVRENH